ncbi:MAG: TlpA family protein disulfide reductase [Chitinophagales bacterium]
MNFKKLLLPLLLFFSSQMFLFSVSAQNNIFLQNLQGKQISFEQKISEKPITILKFWSAWAADNCRPCEMDLERSNKKFATEKRNDTFQFITVNIDKNIKDVQKYVAEKTWNFETWIDEAGVLQEKMQIYNIPTILIINNLGEILYHDGQSPTQTFEAALQQILQQE